jgi:hypothetical protein
VVRLRTRWTPSNRGARFVEVQGYWTRTRVKVDVTKAEKVALNNASMPRPEIDVIGWKPSTGELVIAECKSYLDSSVVRVEALHGQESTENDRFKLFNRARLRDVIATALIRQLRAEGLLTDADPIVRFVLVAGKVYSDHESRLNERCNEAGWRLIGPSELADGSEHSRHGDTKTTSLRS